MKKIAYLVFLVLLSGTVLLAQENTAKITKLEKNSPNKIINTQSSVKALNSTTAVSYDFTTGDGSQFYGGSDAAKQMPDGKWAMIAGDADQNGGIGASDLTNTRSELGSIDYNDSDIDMNGGVGSTDLVIIRQNLGKTTQLP